ncbi:MAG: sulfonate/nitrate transporter [Hyphomicrobiales bacterium]|nr:sulfonate/nitrate transporter [Hyphomicrobiales bacterium]
MPAKLFTSVAMMAGLLFSGSSIAADRLTYQLGWLPGGDKAPAYLALQKGLFAAEGLEVTIASGRGSEDVLSKVGTDVYEMGEVAFDALLSRHANGHTSVLAVMPYYSKQPDALITTTSSGINTLKDVKGRTIGTSPFTSSNVAWPVVLAANDVSPDSFKLIKVDASALTAMLATGQIDAMINWTPAAAVAARMLKTSGKEAKVIPWSDYGFEGYSQSIVVSSKFLKEKPDAVKRFVKVMQAAIEMVGKDPNGGADAVKASVPEADIDVLRAQAAASVPLMVNEVTAKDGVGKFDARLVKATWAWVSKAANLSPDKLDPMSAIAPDMKPR